MDINSFVNEALKDLNDDQKEKVRDEVRSRVSEIFRLQTSANECVEGIKREKEALKKLQAPTDLTLEL